MSEEKLRRRNPEPDNYNGISEEVDVKEHDPDFSARDSPLTVLFESSLRSKAVYHMFVAILIMLILETITYDLVERGRLDVGLRIIVSGFSGASRGLKLWLFELGLALAFHPGLQLYSTGVALFHRLPVCLQVWKILGFLAVVGLQTALFAVPVWSLATERLAIAWAVLVTVEMLRFAMKIHAVCVACAPRCRLGGLQLPSFKHYLYFLFAPTLLYRDYYPRSRRVRWHLVARYLLEVAGIIFYNSFLWERHVIPNWVDYGKEPKVEAGKVVRSMFACILVGVIYFLDGFYWLLHAWLNFFAEIMTFADRMFYEEWWATSQYSKYYRAWNRVVYVWLRRHIYQPLTTYTNRTVATFCVFFVSAVAHELVLALSFGFFYPVLLVEFGLLGVLVMPMTASAGRRYPGAVNLFIWMGLVFGNGILWTLYPMEHFARQNCPPSENDSFFKPKSWSCPEIVFNPNWTFHNPLDLFY